MTRSYYVFANTNSGEKVLVNEGDYRNAKVIRNINLDARADNVSVYNNYRIARFTSKKEADRFLNDTSRITKPIMISNKPKPFSDNTRTYRETITNIQSRNDMANKLNRLVTDIKARNAKSIFVRFTYIKDANKERPIYKMYSVLLDIQLQELIKMLRDNRTIDYEQEDGSMVNYENDGFYLDYTEIDLIFRADISVGTKGNYLEKIEIEDKIFHVIPPPIQKVNDKSYNCFQELLCLIFNNVKQQKIAIKKIIKTMPTLDQIDNEFKITLNETDILTIEKQLDLKTNYIKGVSDGEFDYYYKSDSKNINEINFLLYNQHIYIIKEVFDKKLVISEDLKPETKAKNKFIYIFYDYETLYSCYERKHIPSMIGTTYLTYYDENWCGDMIKNKKLFINKNCTRHMISYYENLFPEHTRIYVGFNSSKFDVFFIINHLIDSDLRPKINVYKDKLFVESDFNIFTDLLPLLPLNSLQKHCEDFNTKHKKLKGDVSFHYHNMIFNSPDYANGSLDKYFELINTILVKDSRETIFERMENYCYHDVYCTADLYIDYGNYVNLLVEDKYGLNHIYLSNFKTLGELAMTILLTIEHNKENEPDKFIRKSKDLKYKYAAIIKSEKVQDTTNIYKYCREAILASISYAKRNTILTEKELQVSVLALIDVISLYPFVLSNDSIFGYGNLTYIEINNFITDKLIYGIYDVEITFNKKKFQRVPYQGDSYEWIHQNTIRRKLYAQDINHLIESEDANVFVFDGYQFELQATAKEIFGSYMGLFTDEKNKQDLLKENKDNRYNAGIRETCKAFMNILSGKLVQVYGYETKLNCKYSSIENSVDDDIVDKETCIDEGKFTIYKTKKAINSRKEIYDISIVGGQLYTYSREHMQKIIDRIYTRGYEPYVIETDSIIVDRQFILHDALSNPKSYCGTFKDGIYHRNLKEFGQFDIENDYITQLYVYGKKSYYFKYSDNGKIKEKYRFKGTSKNAIACNKELKTILGYYNKMKSYYEKQFQIHKVKENIKEKLADANYLISNTISYELQQPKNLLINNPAATFTKLIKGEEFTIIQTLIKKNYIRNLNQQLSLENVIITKTFNPKDDNVKAVQERGFDSAYEYIKNKCKIRIISQED